MTNTSQPQRQTAAPLGAAIAGVLFLLTVAMIGTAISTPAYPQNTSSPASSLQAQTAEVRAVTLVAPPLVLKENGSLTGFSIDLWDAIAAQLKLKTSYQIVPDVSAVLEAMQSKRADLTVSIFITSARDEVFDFSYPILDAGLQIMVLDTGQKVRTESPIWDVLRLLFSQTTILWLGMALLLVLIPAHLVWLFERRNEDSIISNRNYFPGIFEAIFWGLSTLTTQAENMPRQWVVRTFSIFWMFAGVVFVAFYTAQLTTTLTVEQIRGAIEGPGDLPGKQVGTVTNTLAVDYLREQKAQVHEFPTVDQMFQALLDKKVDAVVTGAPVLLYYAAHEGKGRVKVVGPEFNRAPVAIMVQLDSPLRRQIDVAMMKLRENGTYRQLYDKWFGAP